MFPWMHDSSYLLQVLEYQAALERRVTPVRTLDAQAVGQLAKAICVSLSAMSFKN